MTVTQICDKLARERFFAMEQYYGGASVVKYQLDILAISPGKGVAMINLIGRVLNVNSEFASAIYRDISNSELPQTLVAGIELEFATVAELLMRREGMRGTHYVHRRECGGHTTFMGHGGLPSSTS